MAFGQKMFPSPALEGISVIAMGTKELGDSNSAYALMKKRACYKQCEAFNTLITFHSMATMEIGIVTFHLYMRKFDF